MAEIPQILMDIRKELMISPKGGIPMSKTSHFIKPMLQFPDKTPVLPTVNLAFRPVLIECVFNGWRSGTEDEWVNWVDKLAPKFKALWKKAGIFDAIMSSRFRVIKNEELVLGLVERWCCETNTFVFPWGEATVTLEDVMVLGGFSVLGSSVYGYNNDRQVAEVEEQLMSIYDKLSKEGGVSQAVWMKKFMGTGSEIEHEAFLSVWLSRFVFPTYPFDSIVSKCFRFAVCLAKGIEIALAPFVLASIYRDLSLIKSAMRDFAEIGVGSDDLLMVSAWAPLQLVQVWVWERFPEFRPKPKRIGVGKPRIARWDDVNEEIIGNARAVLQSCGDSFVWRPYCKAIDGLPTPGCVFREAEQWVFMDEGVRKDVQILARCLRVGELVGLESIEQYNPHRVAMQFGYDQDLPVLVKRDLVGYGIPQRELQQLAWLSYSNPIKDQMLYIPSISYVPQVTLRYLEWFREGVLIRWAALKGIVKRKRGSVRLRRLEPPLLLFNMDEADLSSFSGDDLAVHSGWDLPSSDVTEKVDVPGFVPKTIGNVPDVPPGFTPINDLIVPSGFTPKPSHSGVAKRKADELHEFGVKKKAVYVATDELPGPPGFVSKSTGTNLDVPPGFPPKSSLATRKADVPPGFIPKSIGTNLDVPPGFPPKSSLATRKADVPPGFVPKSIGTNLDVPPGFPPKSSLATGKADVPPGFVPKRVGNHSDVPPGFKPLSVTPKKVIDARKEGLGPEPFVKVEKKWFE